MTDGTYHRTIGWPQGHLRRGLLAYNKLRDERCTDGLIIVKAILEAAISKEADLLEILPARRKPKAEAA